MIPQGESDINVTVNGKNNLMRFMVVKDGSPILGRDACVHLGLV